jgi:hypothetical protein
MNKQNFIQHICHSTGLSKRSLAGYADASQSTLSRYGSGTRDLPIKAFLPLVKMHTELQASAAHAQPAATEEDIEEVKARAQWCLAQCYPLQKKLASMQLNYQQGIAMLGLLGTLSTENNADITPKKQRWMDDQYFIARKKCASNGWAAQTKITTAIALLQYEAAVLNTVAENNSKEEVK